MVKPISGIKKVVVVDDNPTMLKLFERSTEKLTIELYTYSSANDSMEFLEKEKPSLLFLDILMPNKDGLTFLQELRKLPLHSDTMVVMISSEDYEQDKTIANKLGALDFITKPMSISTITSKILNYINCE